MKKTILLGLLSIVVVIAGVAAVSAFEAWVINVTAHIENALYVHPESRNFGTVFPQEYFTKGFFVTFSESFSEEDQTRVLNVDYQIGQKPKPTPEFIAEVGLDEARRWCHDNKPVPPPDDPNDPYYENCYPILCPYLSKDPRYPEPGDIGLSVPHDQDAKAYGTINKEEDPGDEWVIDFPVPCFEGQCDQEYLEGWRNGIKADPAPAGLDGETFGCDLWVEVTEIY